MVMRFMLLFMVVYGCLASYPCQAQESYCTLENYEKLVSLKVDLRWATDEPIPNRPMFDSAVSWARYCPPAMDQGNEASCMAWSIGYSWRGFQFNKERELRNTAVDGRYSPQYLHNICYCLSDKFCPSELDRPYSCKGTGFSWPEIVKTARMFGFAAQVGFDVSREADACLRSISPECIKDAKQDTLAGYVGINPNLLGDNLLNTLFYYLSTGEPVVVELRRPKNFKTLYLKDEQGVKEWLVHSEADLAPGKSHAMLCVGYNQTERYFLLYNTFGVDWGDKGFIKISFDMLKRDLVSACVPKFWDSPTLIPIKGKRMTKGLADMDTFSWFKPGYYRQYGGIRFGLAGLDTEKRQIKVVVTDDKNYIQNTLYLKLYESNYFYIDSFRLSFTFTEIGRDGCRKRKPSARFHIRVVKVRSKAKENADIEELMKYQKSYSHY